MKLTNGILRYIGKLDKDIQSIPPNTSDEHRQRLLTLAAGDEKGINPLHGAKKGLSSEGGETDRMGVIRTCRRMSKSDPRADAILDRLSRDVSQRFQVVQRGNTDQKTDDIIGEMSERFAFKRLMRPWLYDLYQDGDLFIETGISGEKDQDRKIVELSQKPTLNMERVSDDYDRFPDPTKAFRQNVNVGSKNAFAAYGIGRQDEEDTSLYFPQFLIEHIRYNHRNGGRYGNSLMMSTRGAFNKMTDGELNAALRRASDTGTTFVHYAEGAQQDQINEYMEKNKRVLNDQLALVRDIFSNQAPGSVQRFQGNSNLGQIADIEHHVQTFFTRSPVPMVLLGYGNALNRDVFEYLLACYADYIADDQEWLAEVLVKPLYHRELMLHGILPAHNPLDVIWIKSDKASPDTIKSVGDAIIKLQTTNLFDLENLINICIRYIPGIDRDSLLAYAQEQQTLTVSDNVNRLGELAQIGRQALTTN